MASGLNEKPLDILGWDGWDAYELTSAGNRNISIYRIVLISSQCEPGNVPSVSQDTQERCARKRKHPRPNRPKPMKFHPTTSGLAVSDTGPGPYDAIQFALSSPPGSGVAVEPN